MKHYFLLCDYQTSIMIPIHLYEIKDHFFRTDYRLIAHGFTKENLMCCKPGWFYSYSSRTVLDILNVVNKQTKTYTPEQALKEFFEVLI